MHGQPGPGAPGNEPPAAPAPTGPKAPAPATVTGGKPPSPPAQEDSKSFTENLKIVGGLAALVAGLLVLAAIVGVAIFHLPADKGGSAAATAGITAVASMVGAYFGVKVGSDGTKGAVEGQKEEAKKAQAFAFAADPAKLDVIQALLNDDAPKAPPQAAGAPAAPPRAGGAASPPDVI